MLLIIFHIAPLLMLCSFAEFTEDWREKCRSRRIEDITEDEKGVTIRIGDLVQKNKKKPNTTLRTYSLRLRTGDTDKEIYNQIEKQDNPTKYLKRLIREDIKRTSSKPDEPEIEIKEETAENSRIHEIRAKSGLSQSKFAQAFGMSKRALQSYEHGDRNIKSWIVDLIEYRVDNDETLQNYK